MKKLEPTRITPATYVRHVYRVSPAEGTALEELLEPSYWAHVASKFTVNDKIEVAPEGGAYYSELLVTHCSGIHAKVVVLLHKKLADTKAEAKKDDADPFIVEWKGPQHKWSVIRKEDKAYVKEGFEKQADADAWLSANRADLTK